MVVLDGVSEVKDGESCTLFGAIDMAICGEMRFGRAHDRKSCKRAQTVDGKRNDENTGGTSQPFV